jgi:filamentous hemagglutinin family protein
VIDTFILRGWMMKRFKRSLKGCSWRKGVSCLLAWLLIVGTSAPAVLALESGNIISQSPGGIIGTPTWGDNTVINTDHQAIINWNNFNTSSTQSVTFNQYKSGELSSLSAVLNRISSGAVPTQFDGALNANGRVFIVNPAGIAFGAGSVINVTQLVASGLNMSDADFLNATGPSAAQFRFEGGNGEVTNRAQIFADSVYLVGKKVLNVSGIRAPSGLVVMAAGDNVYVAQDGSSVVVQVAGEGDGYPDVQNRSRISVDPDLLHPEGGGKIVLAAADTFSRAITNVGIITASDGTITARAAIVQNDGVIDASAGAGTNADGGTVSLTGTESVVVGPDGLGKAGIVAANAGANGNGGTVTIQTDGLFRIDEYSSITADGGGVSGNGGSVTINCGDFEIFGDISAAPGNKIEEPGRLEINTSSDVLIADGANAGAANTLYEDDIEALSQGATSLIVNTEGNIAVQDITDAVGNGEITGQFGDIELHATGADSAVAFAANTDTIRTTLGDIIVEAGSGGMNIGNLTTGKDLSDQKPAPGRILLSTNNGGNITTEDLTIRDGWGHAEIDADSSGNLTVNGDVIVGSESDILNVAGQRAAEAVIKLKADNDIVLEGVVEAHTYGIEEDTSITKAYIDVSAGNNVTINDDLLAEAKSSAGGTADAIVKIEAVGDITFVGGAMAHAVANDGAAEAGPSTESEEDTSIDGDHAQLIINDNAIFLVDDAFETPKSAENTVLDVLANDTLEGETTIDSFDIDPSEGSLTTDEVGGKTVLIYNPPEDLSTLTFDESGKATVTFTYTVSDKMATVTITLTNSLPVAVKDLAKTYQDQAVKISVIVNDTDSDKDDSLTPVLGGIAPKNGTVVLNANGTFTYTPNKGYLGDDSFTYKVTDGFNTSSEVEVKITVAEEPPAHPTPLVLPYIYPAPGLDGIRAVEVKVSGCPALVKWAAEEIGIDQRLVQIWVANSLASTGDIQPCNACQELKNAAKILQDANGAHIAALARVINEFASSTAPPTEEQMAAIKDAITRNTDEDSHYAVANEYLDALAAYVGVLSSEMGFSTVESVQIVTDKYISRLTQDQNVGVAAFLAASLAALGG